MNKINTMGFVVPTTIIIVAGLVIAVVLILGSILLFRNRGKSRKGVKQTPTSGLTEWQRQPQQAPIGNQAGMGNQAGVANNPWGQPLPQQPAAWGAPLSAPQQPPAWGAPIAAQPAGNQVSWERPLASPVQDPWAGSPPPQPQTAALTQQGAPAWNGQQSGAPQQVPTAYGANNPGINWDHASLAANPWGGQPVQPAIQQPPTPITPSNGNTATPIWQQPTPLEVPYQPWQPNVVGNNGDERTALRDVGQGSQVSARWLGIVRIEEGKEPGRIYEMRKPSLSIGRSRESDIFLEDLAVSRLHASIVNMNNGDYALKDEGSANGTKVNGQLVNKHQVYPLQEGDKIQLGQTVLVFAKQ